jgi:hypothetical protein
MITSEEELALLDHIRRWNKKYPEKNIFVGYSDIEHDFQTTIRNIILPYIRLIDPEFTINIDQLNSRDLGEITELFDTYLIQAEEENLIGEYPFITPDYIARVLDNLKSTYYSYHYQFNYYRQKAIIRNLTDPQFLGEYFLLGKVLLHGGSYHTPTHFEYPGGANFFREGSYLSYDFEPTKGRAFSIRNHGVSNCLGTMAQVDISECLHQGSGYRNRLNKMREAYAKKLISENDHVFEWDQNELTRLVLKKAAAFENHPVVIKSVNWDSLLHIADSCDDSGLIRSIKRLKKEFSEHDVSIYIPQSPLTVARKKE